MINKFYGFYFTQSQLSEVNIYMHLPLIFFKRYSIARYLWVAVLSTLSN